MFTLYLTSTRQSTQEAIAHPQLWPLVKIAKHYRSSQTATVRIWDHCEKRFVGDNHPWPLKRRN